MSRIIYIYTYIYFFLFLFLWLHSYMQLFWKQARKYVTPLQASTSFYTDLQPHHTTCTLVTRFATPYPDVS